MGTRGVPYSFVVVWQLLFGAAHGWWFVRVCDHWRVEYLASGIPVSNPGSFGLSSPGNDVVVRDLTQPTRTGHGSAPEDLCPL